MAAWHAGWRKVATAPSLVNRLPRLRGKRGRVPMPPVLLQSQTLHAFQWHHAPAPTHTGPRWRDRSLRGPMPQVPLRWHLLHALEWRRAPAATHTGRRRPAQTQAAARRAPARLPLQPRAGQVTRLRGVQEVAHKGTRVGVAVGVRRAVALVAVGNRTPKRPRTRRHQPATVAAVARRARPCSEAARPSSSPLLAPPFCLRTRALPAHPTPHEASSPDSRGGTEPNCTSHTGSPGPEPTARAIPWPVKCLGPLGCSTPACTCAPCEKMT